MFDSSAAAPSAFWLGLAAFTVTAAVICAWPALAGRFVRVQRHQRTVYYAGAALIAGGIAISALVLSWPLWLGLAGAAGLLLVGGTLDEKIGLPPGQQLVWQLAAAVTAVSAGWTIPFVTHPFAAGVLRLDWLVQGTWAIPGSLLAIGWLVLLMNALNWLDGVDGAAVGVSSVAFIALAGVSLLPATQDATTFTLALIGLGGSAAFLVWNWPPARVYLGSSGVWFLGLYLGLTAIIGGGKIATTILVLAIPLLDAGLVSLERLLAGQPPWRGRDHRHMHDRLRARRLPASYIIGALIIGSGILAVASIALATSMKAVLAAGLALLLLAAHGTVKRLLNYEKNRR